MSKTLLAVLSNDLIVCHGGTSPQKPLLSLVMGPPHHPGGVAERELYSGILRETVVLLTGFLSKPAGDPNGVKKGQVHLDLFAHASHGSIT